VTIAESRRHVASQVKLLRLVALDAMQGDFHALLMLLIEKPLQLDMDVINQAQMKG
jgi:hypothetical protein